MSWSKRVRQTHRWLSLAFTVAVVANIAALGQEEPVLWVGLVALVPLALLLFTGLYLFVLPHAARWRSGGGGVPTAGRTTDGLDAGGRP